MKKSNKMIASGMMLMMLTSACAKMPGDIVENYHSKAEFMDKDCKELDIEFERENSELIVLNQIQASKANTDRVSTVIGAILFAPAILVPLFTGSKEDDIKDKKGKVNAISRAYKAKCLK